jgi:catechol 2,3-dioxygenase-like lactoylglutathione lyase family enzyme
MIIFTMTLLRWHPSGCASCPDHLLRSEIAHRAVLTSIFQIWLQHVQPGEICYQQRRMRPYISVAHPRPTEMSDPPCRLLSMDWKIELVAIPVTDVDRAKEFYVDRVGFHADHDYQVTETLRFVQLTPPGSACSIVMGTGITEMAPGTQKGVQVVVADVEAARRELIERGVQASDVDVQPWGSFVTFSDPDGNTWALQQLPPRP